MTTEQDSENKIVQRVADAVVFVFIVVFSIVAIGTAVLPALLACLFGWQWMAVYPCAFAAFVTWARSKRPQ